MEYSGSASCTSGKYYFWQVDITKFPDSPQSFLTLLLLSEVTVVFPVIPTPYREVSSLMHAS